MWGADLHKNDIILKLSDITLALSDIIMKLQVISLLNKYITFYVKVISPRGDVRVEYVLSTPLRVVRGD